MTVKELQPNPVALITGASEGIGLSVSRELSRLGYAVIITARSASKLLDVVQAINKDGGDAVALPGDLTNETDMNRIIHDAESWRGGVDVLVNNAGIGYLKSFLEHTQTEYDRMFALNVRAPFALMRALIPRMIERGGGDVVNVLSGAARQPVWADSVYGATKASLRMMADVIRMELNGQNIRMLTVHPGPTDTGFFAHAGKSVNAEKFIKPEDIARMIGEILCLDRRASITEIDIRPTEA